jgi:hypothetical protein
MKHRKKISEPVYLNLSEELKRWTSGLKIKSNSTRDEKNQEEEKFKENTIQITFLKKKQ